MQEPLPYGRYTLIASYSYFDQPWLHIEDLDLYDLEKWNLISTTFVLRALKAVNIEL